MQKRSSLITECLRSRYASRPPVVPRPRSPQNVFERSREFGLLVAVFDDDRGVNREPEVLARTVLDSAGTGYNDSPRRDYERHFGRGAQDGVVREVIDWGAACEDGACGEHSLAADDRALIDTGVSADEDVVLDDDG